MSKYEHTGMTYENPEIDVRREYSGQTVRGGADRARQRMLNRDKEYRREVERKRAEAEAAKLREASDKEKQRLDQWARNTGFYKDYADYEKHRDAGRLGYAD